MFYPFESAGHTLRLTLMEILDETNFFWGTQGYLMEKSKAPPGEQEGSHFIAYLRGDRYKKAGPNFLLWIKAGAEISFLIPHVISIHPLFSIFQKD